MSNECDDNKAAGCDEALENLYLYLDSELDSVTSERIRSHLDDCHGCVHSFEFEKRLKSVVKERLDEEVPDVFVARLRTALAREAAGDTK
jgi:mycothiol system anti-sigma-R factor